MQREAACAVLCRRHEIYSLPYQNSPEKQSNEVE